MNDVRLLKIERLLTDAEKKSWEEACKDSESLKGLTQYGLQHSKPLGWIGQHELCIAVPFELMTQDFLVARVLSFLQKKIPHVKKIKSIEMSIEGSWQDQENHKAALKKKDDFKAWDQQEVVQQFKKNFQMETRLEWFKKE